MNGLSRQWRLPLVTSLGLLLLLFTYTANNHNTLQRAHDLSSDLIPSSLPSELSSLNHGLGSAVEWDTHEEASLAWKDSIPKLDNDKNHGSPATTLAAPEATSISVSVSVSISTTTTTTTTTTTNGATAATTQCPVNPKPNLILSAVDGGRWSNAVFLFLQSLELALGRDALEAARQGECAPAPVLVKIITTADVSFDLPQSFKALMQRYPNVEFVGAMPDMEVAVVYRRFQGWSDYLSMVADGYDKVLACDLDLTFQRNPFTAQPMNPGVEIIYYPEFRGVKIGQCGVHQGWFRGCVHEGVVTKEQVLFYNTLDRICAGSVYGTARAIEVYMRTMANELYKSDYSCNDQAMHIHIFYSGILDIALHQAGMGRVWAVPNEEAMLGTVGTTPMVSFNEWGEVLNERGQVQCAIHQFKYHSVLSDIMHQKYGWVAEVGRNDAVPIVPDLTIESEPPRGDDGKIFSDITDAAAAYIDDDSSQLYLNKHGRHGLYVEYSLPDIPFGLCGSFDRLCSCRYDDCQVHYEGFV